MSNSARTDTLVMQAIRVVHKNKHGSTKTRHNHIKKLSEPTGSQRKHVGHQATAVAMPMHRIVTRK